MGKRLALFLLSLIVASNAMSADNFIPKKFSTVTSHDDVYPYLLNNTKTKTNKNTTSTNTINSISAAPIGKRNVVKRKTNARAATNISNSANIDTSTRRVVPRTQPVSARAAMTSNQRRVVNRNSQNIAVRSMTPGRARTTSSARVVSNNRSSTTEKVSSKRCFADYKECMEMYCQREDTAYNRCYCSAKLAQIDSKYQNKIDDLIQQIVRLQYGGTTTSEEIKEYWDKTVGVYTKTNPWVNIENALNIDWADTQSRIRGQNAFNTGHEYCVQNLRSCYYMASNMRDAYKSEITRDCDAYEKSLQKIQDAAESVIESYKN